MAKKTNSKEQVLYLGNVQYVDKHGTEGESRLYAVVDLRPNIPEDDRTHQAQALILESFFTEYGRDAKVRSVDIQTSHDDDLSLLLITDTTPITERKRDESKGRVIPFPKP